MREPFKEFPPEDRGLFEASWEITRARQGNGFTFYLPGMIRYGRDRGRYPAISITGEHCGLQCEHCKGRLLEPMIKVTDPERLIGICKRLSVKGAHGVLLTGGSDLRGRLPWERYLHAVKKIKDETPLVLSAHTGFPPRESSLFLKKAGLDQALLDVMGDHKTASSIYHLPGMRYVTDALDGIKESGLELIPHIVAGLYHGEIRAEYQALKIIKEYRPTALVFVVLTPLKGTPMAVVNPPAPMEVLRLMATARIMMPRVPISLGCERPRGKDGLLLERGAILAGANRMAVWSPEATNMARCLGLKPRFQATCCSLSHRSQFLFQAPQSPS